MTSKVYGLAAVAKTMEGDRYKLWKGPAQTEGVKEKGMKTKQRDELQYEMFLCALQSSFLLNLCQVLSE